jgi:hypothetical protein
MRRENYIKVTLSDDELAKLDERRPDGLTRAQWLRELARGSAATDEQPSRAQVIAVLWRQARDGKTQAAVALERALRPHTGLRNEPPEYDDDELEQLLSG